MPRRSDRVEPDIVTFVLLQGIQQYHTRPPSVYLSTSGLLRSSRNSTYTQSARDPSPDDTRDPSQRTVNLRSATKPQFKDRRNSLVETDHNNVIRISKYRPGTPQIPNRKQVGSNEPHTTMNLRDARNKPHQLGSVSATLNSLPNELESIATPLTSTGARSRIGQNRTRNRPRWAPGGVRMQQIRYRHVGLDETRPAIPSLTL